jgi:energy-coupling factor transporter ATP-binding protein EcfA2
VRPPALEPEDVALYVGKRGSGKSTRAKQLLAAAMAAGQPCVAFDPHDEYSQEGRQSSQVRLGPLTQRMTVEQLAADPDALLEKRLSLAVVPEGLGPREKAEAFSALVDEVLDAGDVVLLADEVGQWGRYCAEQLDELACQSRHSGVPVVLVAQRLVQVPKTARTQATLVNSGRQDNPDDLAALADLAGEGFSEAVARLKRGECVQWVESEGRWPRKQKEKRK